MKIEEFVSQVSGWEIRRANRVNVEKQFTNYSGLIHAAELHIPYTKWEYVFDMLKEAKRYKGKKIFVSGGDSVNLDMLSFFYHRGGHTISPIEELAMLIKWLKEAQKVYDKIIFISSNHEMRVQKFLNRSIQDKTQAEEATKLMKTFKEMFSEAGINKIVYADDFFFQVGDCIFSHFENNSAIPGAVGRWIIQYLVPRIKKEWQICFQFHTHSQEMLMTDRKICIQPGAMVDTLDYWRSGKLAGKGKMSSIGYGTCEMKSGKVDLKTARPVVCGWESFL